MNKKDSVINIKQSAVGILLSTLIAIALICIYAFLISKERIQITSVPIIIPVIHFIAAACGGLYICRAGKEKPFIKCAIQAAISLCLIIVIILTVFTGNFNINATSSLAIILGYMGAAIVHIKKKGRAKSVRYKYKNS